MKINELTLKAIKESPDHEDMYYVESANIYLGGKKVGTYMEDYMCGPTDVEIDPKHIETVEEIGKKYFAKYPLGFKNEDKGFSIQKLYSGNEAEGICTELIEMWRTEKEAKKAFKAGYKYYAEVKKTPRSYAETYYVPNETALQKLKDEGLIIIFVADRDNDAFTITV